MRLAVRATFVTQLLALALLAATPAHALDDPLREMGVTPYCWRRHGTKFEGDSGASVVVGIVWIGFDLFHPDFMDENGRSRVLAVWDQRGAPGGTASFGYGTEWTAAEVDNRRADIPGSDKGTALALLAAGSGRLRPSLTGVAPEAKLVLVVSTLDPWDIVDAVDYVFRAAAAAHLPAVVDLSLNTHLSSHDGSDSLDARLNHLSGPGRIVVAAAGNEGGSGIHAAVVLSGARRQNVAFEIHDTGAGALGPDLNKLCMLLVYPPSADVTIGLRNPSGTRVLTAPKGNFARAADSLVQLELCNGAACVDHLSFPGKSIAELALFGAGNRWRVPGTWTLELETVRCSAIDRLDAWIQTPAGGPMARFERADDTDLVGWPACADSVLSVGAYEPAATWGDGRDALWPETSPGPRRDGREAVDFVAPGFRVSVPAAPDSTAQWNGTSFAAAYATGAVALLLAVHPGASPGEIRNELRRRARPLSGVGESKERTGSGKLWMGAAAP